LRRNILLGQFNHTVVAGLRILQHGKRGFMVGFGSRDAGIGCFSPRSELLGQHALAVFEFRKLGICRRQLCDDGIELRLRRFLVDRR